MSKLGFSEPEGASSESSTRRRILDAARDEFARYGKAGARVDRIASTAGINKAMLYYHFGSKEDLYLAVIDRYLAEVATVAQQRTLSETTLEGVLGGLSEAYSAVFEQIQDLRPVLLRELASGDSPTLDRMAHAFRMSGVPGKLKETLTKAAATGSAREVDLRQVLVSFITMNVGYILMAPMIDRILEIEDRREFIGERRHAVVDLFLNGLLKR